MRRGLCGGGSRGSALALMIRSETLPLNRLWRRAWLGERSPVHYLPFIVASAVGRVRATLLISQAVERIIGRSEASARDQPD